MPARRGPARPCARSPTGSPPCTRAGIVHRDVKPDNVFLVGEQGAPYAREDRRLRLRQGPTVSSASPRPARPSAPSSTWRPSRPSAIRRRPAHRRLRPRRHDVPDVHRARSRSPRQSTPPEVLARHQLAAIPPPPGLAAARSARASTPSCRRRCASAPSTATPRWRPARATSRASAGGATAALAAPTSPDDARRLRASRRVLARGQLVSSTRIFGVGTACVVKKGRPA